MFNQKDSILKAANKKYDVIYDEDNDDTFDVVFNRYIEKYKNKKLNYQSILYAFDMTSSIYGYGIKKQ